VQQENHEDDKTQTYIPLTKGTQVSHYQIIEKIGAGGMGILGQGPGGPQCPEWTYSQTFYLYDNGVLLATFDKYDNVEDLFVNGPGGRIASYWENDDNKLHYYVADHLGSARVLMNSLEGQPEHAQVAQYYNYHPFGAVSESWGNYNTPYRFTSKEHDQHSSFDFYYFGARYYDPRIGQFTTIDKASQFASGFVYGGNNPISVIDPDGNISIFGLELRIDWGSIGRSIVEFFGSEIEYYAEHGRFFPPQYHQWEFGMTASSDGTWEYDGANRPKGEEPLDPDLFAAYEVMCWWFGVGPEYVRIKNAPLVERELMKTSFWRTVHGGAVEWASQRLAKNLPLDGYRTSQLDTEMASKDFREFTTDFSLLNHVVGSWSGSLTTYDTEKWTMTHHIYNEMNMASFLKYIFPKAVDWSREVVGLRPTGWHFPAYQRPVNGPFVPMPMPLPPFSGGQMEQEFIITRPIPVERPLEYLY